MDINKIKERLAALRPEDLDPEDPEVGELLMLVEEDLELAEWFAQQQVFDQAFSEKLQSIKPSAGLEARILAAMEQAAAQTEEAPAPQPETAAPQSLAIETDDEMDDFDMMTADELADEPVEEMAERPAPAQIGESEESESEMEDFPEIAAAQKVISLDDRADEEESTEEREVGTAVPFNPTPKRSWWKNPGILSAAAAVILLLTITMMSLNGPTAQAASIDDFYRNIGAHHHRNPAPDMASDSLDAIREYLGQQNAPVPGNLPASIDPYAELGCSIMQWGTEVVSIIHMDDQEDVHVYIVRHGLFPDFEDRPQPQLVQLDQVVVLGWSDGTMHYFLVRTGDLSEIDSML